MGLTRVSVTLVNPTDQVRLSNVELIVDTGSILTWVGGRRLEDIGVKPRREKEFRTIEGRLIRRRTGPAVIRYNSAEADIEVVFGESGDAEVLGVTALESMGYQVDPVTKELRRSSLLAL
jgi:predicted aspartyl protease